MALGLTAKQCPFSSICWNSFLHGLQSISACNVPAIPSVGFSGSRKSGCSFKVKVNGSSQSQWLKTTVISDAAGCLAGAVTQILPIRDRSLYEGPAQSVLDKHRTACAEQCLHHIDFTYSQTKLKPLSS